MGFACLKDGAMKKIAATLLLVIVSSVLAGARPGNFTPYTLDRKQSKLEIQVFREGFLKAFGIINDLPKTAGERWRCA